MADAAVLGPFGECDLAQQDGLDPVDGLPFASAKPGSFGRVMPGFVTAILAKRSGKIAGAFHRKSSPNFAGVMQRAFFPVAKIKRP